MTLDKYNYTMNTVRELSQTDHSYEQLIWHTDQDKSRRYAANCLKKMEEYMTIKETYSMLSKYGTPVMEVTNDGVKIYKNPNATNVKKIIHSGPCTIVFWEDDTKTMVRQEKDVPYDEYAAFTAALAKKIYGTNSKVRKIIETKTVEPKEKSKGTYKTDITDKNLLKKIDAKAREVEA